MIDNGKTSGYGNVAPSKVLFSHATHHLGMYVHEVMFRTNQCLRNIIPECSKAVCAVVSSNASCHAEEITHHDQLTPYVRFFPN